MLPNIIKSFKNDYNETCHPSVLQAIADSCNNNYSGYGLDSITQSTTDLLLKLCNCDLATVHFIAGGTLTNLVTIAAFLRPHQAVIAAESGHIGVHETGAIEATGHKILTAKTLDGKLLPKHIRALCAEHDNEHMVQPRLVYISQATELGTIYTKAELVEIHNTCRELDLYLFVDGARLGAALTAKDNVASLAEMARLCDAFYVGGTKNGALFGEALVLIHKDIQNNFRYLCKQRGAMLAKGWAISAQFKALLTDNLYFELAQNANDIAKYLSAELESLGLSLFIPTYTNQIFPIVLKQTASTLAQSYAFETWSKSTDTHVIRFVTSWNSTKESADDLVKALKLAMK